MVDICCCSARHDVLIVNVMELVKIELPNLSLRWSIKVGNWGLGIRGLGIVEACFVRLLLEYLEVTGSSPKAKHPPPTFSLSTSCLAIYPQASLAAYLQDVLVEVGNSDW